MKIYKPRNNNAHKIAAKKYPLYNFLIHDYEIYELTDMTDSAIKKFVQRNVNERHLFVHTTFEVEAINRFDADRKFLLLSFPRTNLTAFNVENDKSWWLQENTTFREHFD